MNQAGCPADDAEVESRLSGQGTAATAAETADTGQALVEPPPGEIIDTQPNSGWTEGSFSVSDDGAARYHLPLWTPAGRRGTQPQLALDYDSRAGNGVIGVGWSLSGLSSIRPCRRTLATDGTNEMVQFGPADAYCMDGQRLREVGPPQGGEQEFRLEKDIYSRIVSYTGVLSGQPDYFKVWTKDGKLLRYGTNGTSNTLEFRAYMLRGQQPENPIIIKSFGRVTAAWPLTQIEDRNGNNVNFHYETIEHDLNRWSVEFVLKEIRYEPNRSVKFEYEDRPDPIETFLPGQGGSVHSRLPRRLKTVKLLHGLSLIRQYTLTYAADSITGRSLLATITDCDALQVCLNPLQFSWSLGKVGSADYEFDEIHLTNITDVGTYSANGFRFTAGDINGDGKDDLLYGDQNNNWKMRFSTGTGYGPTRSTGIPRAGDGSVRPRINPIDFDRDGRLDLLAEVPCPGCLPTTLTRFALYRSTGLTYELYPELDDLHTHPVNGIWATFFIDLDGNGMPDYVAPRFNLPSVRWRYRLNQDGHQFAPMVETGLLSPAPLNWLLRKTPTRAASLNGLGSNLLITGLGVDDGDDTPDYKYDALELSPSGLRRSNPLNLNLPFNKRPHNGSDEYPEHTSLQFADINGDGLVDAIYPETDLSAQLNTGAGFTDLIPGPSDFEPTGLGCSGCSQGIRIVDFNGDGADDVLILHAMWEGAPEYRNGIQLYTWRNGGFVRTPLGVAPQVRGTTTYAFESNQALDFDGDGAMDIAMGGNNSGGRYLRLLRRKGGLPDQLIRVKVAGLGTSACATCRVEVIYTTLADRSSHTPCDASTYPQVCLTRGGSIVAKHRLATGDDQVIWNEYTHTYGSARSDVRGRGWLGFERHTVSTQGGSIETTTTLNNTSTLKLEPGNDAPYAYPYAHLPSLIKTTIVEGDGLQYESSQSTVFTSALGTAQRSYRLTLANTGVQEREKPSGEAWQALRSRSVILGPYDAFGNPVAITTTIPGSRLTVATDTSVLWKVNLRNSSGQIELETYGEEAPITSSRTYIPNTTVLKRSVNRDLKSWIISIPCEIPAPKS